MHPPDREQVIAFLREIVPAVAAVCPRYACDPKRCIQEAAQASGGGRYVLAYNWWQLTGAGDAGYCVAVRPLRDPTSPSGWTSSQQKLAKFRSPQSAVEAWCKATRAAG